MESQVSEKCKTGDIVDLPTAINYLGFQMYRELAQEEENIFFSPFSLSTALSMLFCGVKGNTSKEMREVLGFEIANILDENVKNCFQLLLTTLEKAPDSYTLSSANVLLKKNSFDVKKEFKNDLLEFFKALTLEVDFSEGMDKVIQQANDWVKEKTNGMISQLLKKLNPNTVMILLNAVYFKGFWQYQFNGKATKPQKFFNKGLAKNIKEVQMMNLKNNFLFTDEKTYKAIQLPYKGDEIAMVILLPNEKNGLEELESKICQKFLSDLKSKMLKQNVIVALPKFRLEYSKSMPKSFKKLGVNEIFTTDGNFSGITDSPYIFVSDIIHKAVIEVNEEGSEAAAATAVVLALRCAPRPRVKVPEFIVDHPFLFIIQNTTNNLILFMGRIDEL